MGEKLRQVVAAVEYLHDLEPAVVHGDIKAVRPKYFVCNLFVCLLDFSIDR